MYRVLDLFSGIGGFSLGLERTGGFKTVAFCEIDPFCRKVLARHWPGVPIHEDVCMFSGRPQQFDIITGGFPCQDISRAGKGAGIEGQHSGLWREFARILGEVRPRYAIVENVSTLLGRGLDRLLGDLAALRFDAEWHCIPACYVGSPQERDRVWIVVSNPDSIGRRPASEEPIFYGRTAPELHPWWRVEPGVGRVAYGVPDQMDRGKAIGRTLVPQIPELIGRAILKAERDLK